MKRLEETILKNLIFNDEYTRKVLPFISGEYFHAKQDKLLFNHILKFVNEYKNLPSYESLVIDLGNDRSISADDLDETITLLRDIKESKEDSVDKVWLLEQTEKFCQDRAIYNAIMESVNILDDSESKKGKGEIPRLLSDALAVSFDNHIGHDYLSDAEERYDMYHRVDTKIPFDIEFLNFITNGGVSNKTLNIVLAGTGCHAKGTDILMNDGSVKKIEDVTQSDVLIGDDGLPREIFSLIRNTGRMYKIKVNFTNDEFIVNEDHILSLINTSNKEILNISVKDYLMKSKKFKHLYKLYYIKTPIKFEKKDLKIDPYFMGLYLGDGHTDSIAVTTADAEIKSYVENIIESDYPYIKIRYTSNGSKAVSMFFSDDYYDECKCKKIRKSTTGIGRRKNRLQLLFSSYGLNFYSGDKTRCEDKFIPQEYKTSSIDDRLQLLAGLIDSDGYKIHNGCYEVCTKSKKLADDINYVSRSLSMGSRIREKVIEGNTYYYVLVTTSFDSEQIIPCKVERKKTTLINTKNRNTLHRSFTVEYVGEDDYYGFNISGNNLYCMGNFLVTHNTGKSLFMCHCASACLMQGYNVLYITLEMSEDKIAERIDANLMNVQIDKISKLSKTDYSSKISNLNRKTQGKLIIKEYPTATASVLNFNALINELKLKKGFTPQIIFVDYLNICKSSRLSHSSNVNSYTYIKAIAEELRGMAVENNVPVFSATQTTRSGFTSSDPGLEDTSESFGLPATADLMFALISTEDLEKLGQIMVKQLKNRYSDLNRYKRFVVGVDKSKMRLFDVENKAQSDIVDSGQQNNSKFNQLKV